MFDGTRKRMALCLHIFNALVFHTPRIGYPLWNTSDCPIVQEFNTALLFAAKNTSIGTVQVLLESGAYVEAKNTTVIESILLYSDIPQIREILAESILCVFS